MFFRDVDPELLSPDLIFRKVLDPDHIYLHFSNKTFCSKSCLIRLCPLQPEKLYYFCKFFFIMVLLLL
jgi:hypothetical protein